MKMDKRLNKTVMWIMTSIAVIIGLVITQDVNCFNAFLIPFAVEILS